MIKPALARGLQLVGATTREYPSFCFLGAIMLTEHLQRMNSGRLSVKMLRWNAVFSPYRLMSQLSSLPSPFSGDSNLVMKSTTVWK